MSNSLLSSSGMARVKEGSVTQFYLPPTRLATDKWHEPYLPLLPSRRAPPPFGWYSFYRPTEGRRLSRPRWKMKIGWKMTRVGLLKRF